MACLDNMDFCLKGQLLVATPLLSGSRFDRSVILVCSHNEEGAMGLFVNNLLNNVNCRDLLGHLKIKESTPLLPLPPIHFGGPMETTSGFIIHTNDYAANNTLVVGQNISITNEIRILRDIAIGKGPVKSMIVLGYAGWGPGQLEQEIKDNNWICAPATEDLIFGTDNDSKWLGSGASLGLDLTRFSTVSGHA